MNISRSHDVCRVSGTHRPVGGLPTSPRRVGDGRPYASRRHRRSPHRARSRSRDGRTPRATRAPPRPRRCGRRPGPPWPSGSGSRGDDLVDRSTRPASCTSSTKKRIRATSPESAFIRTSPINTRSLAEGVRRGATSQHMGVAGAGLPARDQDPCGVSEGCVCRHASQWLLRDARHIVCSRLAACRQRAALQAASMSSHARCANGIASVPDRGGSRRGVNS
jgi:hypothetical protein